MAMEISAVRTYLSQGQKSEAFRTCYVCVVLSSTIYKEAICRSYPTMLALYLLYTQADTLIVCVSCPDFPQ